MISVEQLTKSYEKVQALRGVSFQVSRGEIIGLLGPNGAGKTTTMKILTGYLQPNEGTAKVGGFDVVEDPIAVQRLIGYLPENAPLYHDMTVQDYLQMAAELREIPENQRRSLISEALHNTGIGAYLPRPIEELSKGYRQRVGLAQAIMHRPKVLILDEPTNGLDPTQIVEIRSLIRRLAENSTVILSTHNLPEVEATCERAIIIMNGEVKADATLAELTQTSTALFAVNKDASGVEATVGGIPGVTKVTLEDPTDGYNRYRVIGDAGLELCPAIFDIAKERSWRLAELRPEHRTLESVFRDLAQNQGVAA